MLQQLNPTQLDTQRYQAPPPRSGASLSPFEFGSCLGSFFTLQLALDNSHFHQNLSLETRSRSIAQICVLANLHGLL